ncbi:hypothetical protein AZI86_11200 [Bdellovibrio bacteriovorus]|uniref:STAS domain-containing protein n=1 Tax=Bdellovibrio bacteriovorus TaxID=959 RepID=A0A150WLQ9_BDEBC|nr:hypothetical protein [Bdellovibrio bacteriovorus]KYG64765.1 hypothetical protein AZI86_11200 [Bdellovibrio bacteriovorus]
MEFHLEGPISEKTEIFSQDVRKATSLTLDLHRVTFINSIGVKNWITWMMSVPTNCKIELRNCPFVIISQINMVQGFLPKTARVQSFFAPYVDENGDELIRHLTRGVDYEYANGATPAVLTFVENYIDPQTKQEYEPDFVPSKITKFLTDV